MAKRSGQPKKAGPGRPAGGQPWKPVNVVLHNSQIVWLDQLAVDIRNKKGAAINRAALVRGILAAVQASGVDLTGAESEAEVESILAGKIRR